LATILKEHSKIHNKKKKIIEKYNSSSHFYDKRYKAIQEEKYEIILQKYRVKGKNILDMGCGTGLFFERFRNSLVEKGTINSNYVGLDISLNMLLEFKSKIVDSHLIEYTPNLILSDIECLPFRDDIFHSIFALTSLQNLPSVQKGIMESLRVSKNNADFRFSILKKNLELKSLLNILKSKIKDLKLIEIEELEDVIITGKILKQKVN
jgi:ubiquinone/menaquinone biosynthesis C-methylase UbiE